MDRERGRVRVRHALVRDVAYGQIPRAERAAKHRVVAGWIESLGRPDDHAEMLAYHWESALELVRASGGTDARLEEHVRRRSPRQVTVPPLNAYAAAAGHYTAPWSSRRGRRSGAPVQAGRGAVQHQRRRLGKHSNRRGTHSASGDTPTAASAEAILARSHGTAAIIDRCRRISGRQRPRRGDRRRSASPGFSHGRPVSRCSPATSATRTMRYDAPGCARDRGTHRRLTISASMRSPPSGRQGEQGRHRRTARARTRGRDGRSAGSPLLAGALNNLAVVLDPDLAFVAHSSAKPRSGRALRRRPTSPASLVETSSPSAAFAGSGTRPECRGRLHRGMRARHPAPARGPHPPVSGLHEAGARGARRRSRRPRRALELARAAVATPDTMVPALVRTAWARLRLGHVEEAHALFTEAMPLLERCRSRAHGRSRGGSRPRRHGVGSSHAEQRADDARHRAMLAVVDGNFGAAARLYGEAGIRSSKPSRDSAVRSNSSPMAGVPRASAELERALAFYRPVGATLFVERGERLLEEGDGMAQPRRERKVVTVVFCDLVGFTARAESMDPEDVEAMLAPVPRARPLGARAPRRHGREVHRRRGDGALRRAGRTRGRPRARRARCARDPRLRGRGGASSCASASPPARRSSGSTPAPRPARAWPPATSSTRRRASRARRPVNGVLVDETTYRATRTAVDYEDAEPSRRRARPSRSPSGRRSTAHSRFGVDVAHEARAELVGRERELGVIRDAFERARHERTPQLLTLVGVPGIGKSRLVYELSAHRRRRPGAHHLAPGPLPRVRRRGHAVGARRDRQGAGRHRRAGHAGRDRAEAPPGRRRRARRYRRRGVGRVAAARARRPRRRGASSAATAGARRSPPGGASSRRWPSSARSWSSFEDLHWADESLLDFVDELVDWVTDVPLLVVATARPELLERRPGWGGGKLNATTLALAPLSEEQTARAHRAAPRAARCCAAESQQALLERAGGNPLYAEQFAELYLEQGSTDELAATGDAPGHHRRPPRRACSDRRRSCCATLPSSARCSGRAALATRRRRVPNGTSTRSSARASYAARSARRVEGETEFAFAHALVRDVAYGQIARADRAEKHRARRRVDRGPRPPGGPRRDARLPLALGARARPGRRAGDGELAERARLALRDAGDRAFALNAFRPRPRSTTEALELWPDDDPSAPSSCFDEHARCTSGDERRQNALEEARDALLAVGDTEPRGRGRGVSRAGGLVPGRARRRRAAPRACRGARRGDAASAVARRVCSCSRPAAEMLGRQEEAIASREEALAMAEELELDELRAHALTTIGIGEEPRRADDAGDAELEQRARDRPGGRLADRSDDRSTTSASWPIWEGTCRRAEELYLEAQRMAERFGDSDGLRFVRGNLLFGSTSAGALGRGDRGRRRFIAECDDVAALPGGTRARRAAVIRLARGDIDGAREDSRPRARARSRAQGSTRLLPALGSLSGTVATYAEVGRRRGEALALGGADSLPRTGSPRVATPPRTHRGQSSDARRVSRRIVQELGRRRARGRT